MGVLTVNRALVSNTNPTEAQWDTMRTSLLSFFNAASMNEDNVATGGMTYSSLGAPLDDEVMKWTSEDATIKYVSATDKFELKNTEGDIIWAHRTGETITEFMSLRESDAAMEVFGIPTVNESLGSQTVQLMWLLSRYRKPSLQYSDSDIVTIEANGPNADETLVMGRDRLLKIKDRTCSLAVDANGETSGDTGAAVSGRAAGIARTADRWYYIYCVRVQYGDDADGINAILVAHTTDPTSGNIATLNTAFGTGEWTYMGCVRNGYNIAGADNIIVPFINDECGYMRFTQTLVTNQPKGVLLATDNDVDNLTYDLAFGNDGDTKLPNVATRATFGGYRESHGFEMHYREISSAENHFITSGCYHVSELPELTPCLYIEVPLIPAYRVEVVMGNVQTNKRITLAGFLDHYA